VRIVEGRRKRPDEVVIRCEDGRQIRVYVTDEFVSALSKAAQTKSG